ncbi:hypothetical protein [Emticicia sp. 17c]|uniref:hypothetical protein n=1 Tax=Emticicia sp. 17c TaxID=3127704 RepID=UPI00301DBAD6
MDSQDLIRLGKEVAEYEFDSFFLIKVFDYNETLLFEKIMGYELSKPKICFFQNLEGFICEGSIDSLQLDLLYIS